jgi:WG containing repeat
MKLGKSIGYLLTIVLLSSCNHSYSPSIDPKPTPITTNLNSERFIFIRDKKFGYIDLNGKIVIPAQFDLAEKFSEGLAKVTIGKKCGFIDRNGKIVIPIQFDEDRVGGFSEGLAIVEIGGKDGFIDTKGNMVIPPQFRNASSFKNGLAKVQIDLPLKGGTTLNPNGVVNLNGSSGYIDRSGKIVIQPQFVNADDFSEGLAAVDVDPGKYGYINTTGKVVIPFQFADAAQFKNGRANVTMEAGDSSYRTIDRTGKILAISTSSTTNSKNRGKFSNGLALVEIGNRLGYQDKNGKVVIPARYGIPVDDKVHKGNYLAYRNGEYVPRTHISIRLKDSWFSIDANFDRGLALVMIPNKCVFFGKDICHDYGYIDTTGKLVFKF